jgi:hypothetical protein
MGNEIDRVVDEMEEGLREELAEKDAELARLRDALKAALEHETHADGKCGCCWTVKAEAALKGVRVWE